MENLWPRIESFLLEMRSPSQYIGGEFHSVSPSLESADVTFALVFPGSYRVGMSWRRLHTAYAALNGLEGVLAHRAFLPEPDMEQGMRERGLPPFTLESHLPLSAFRVLAFCLPDALSGLNVLRLLEAAGLPLAQKDREGNCPLVIGYGPLALHPEALGAFLDGVVLGDEVAVLPALARALVQLDSQEEADRTRQLSRLARQVSGFYVPCLYRSDEGPGGGMAAVRPGSPDLPQRVRVAPPSEAGLSLVAPVLAYSELLPEYRVESIGLYGEQLEVLPWTQDGAYTPRTQDVLDRLEELQAETGLEELALPSQLFEGYAGLEELLFRLHARFKNRGVLFRVPPLRGPQHKAHLPALLKLVRRGSLTIALGGASARLRDEMGEPFAEEQLEDCARILFKGKWNQVRLACPYGLPGEGEAELRALLELVHRLVRAGKEASGKAGLVRLSVFPFFPRPHTAWERLPMAPLEELQRKASFLRQALRSRKVRVQVRDPQRVFVEASLARGDRRAGRVVERVHKQGRRYDSDGDSFDFAVWMEAFQSEGIDPRLYLGRIEPEGLRFPWSHIQLGGQP